MGNRQYLVHKRTRLRASLPGMLGFALYLWEPNNAPTVTHTDPSMTGPLCPTSLIRWLLMRLRAA